MPNDLTKLKAKPETEDFAHKYTEEGQGKIGGQLLDGYFKSVAKLVDASGVTSNNKVKAIELGDRKSVVTGKRLRN
jgi:hypothetical protein